MKRRRTRLNEGLDPSDFCICVPGTCDYVLGEYQGDHPKDCPGKDICTCPRDAYLEDLGVKFESCQPCSCCSPPCSSPPCSCCCPPSSPPETAEAFLLRGNAAIEHARRVHQRIYRQLLRYEFVTAVDVGFAVKESQEAFLKALAIRIHVGSKLPVTALRKKGLPDMVSTRGLIETAKVSAPGRGTGLQDFWIRAGVPASSLSAVYLPAAAGVDDGGLGYQSSHLRNREIPITEQDPGSLPRDGSPPCECCSYTHCRCCSHGPCPHSESCCCDCERCCCEGDPSENDACRLAISGVPLDIIQANYFPSGGHPGGDFREGVFVDKSEDTRQFSDQENLLIGRGRVTPLVGGISVGGTNGLAGTLTGIVWDETDGSPCALGNWHVLAGPGATVGQPCFQPSIFDGGEQEDVIGHLKRWHFGELGDAALAELDDSRFFASGEILGLWHPISGYRPPELALEVRKWGRTTGFTEGFVDGIQLATQIDYGGGTVRHFEGQFHIAPLYRGDKFSQFGDSGSLVVTTENLDQLAQEKRERRLVVTALLRKGPPELVESLKALIGPGGATEEKDLLESIKDLLEQYESIVDCGSPPMTVSPFDEALEECRADGGENYNAFKELLFCVLEEYGIKAKKFRKKKLAKGYREVERVYFAVGMLFAGDTPGSPFGEFALASDIGLLAKDMRFSVRPVFEPRSSFRRLRSRPSRRGDGRPGRGGRNFEPGAQAADPRPGGPQPDGATYQSGGGNTGGSG